ncbi:LytR/AlgR family response regulator transcription factor [Salegentibacter sp. HM20]
MNCIIVDDEELPRKILQQLISMQPSLELVGVFEGPLKALKFINNTEKAIDLIFLDIMMPDFSGFDFLKTIKSSPDIILVSSDEKFALNAFEFVNVTDYLLKPIQKERFERAIAKLDNNQKKNELKKERDRQAENENELYVNVDKRLVKIDITDIELVEAKGNFIQIKTSNKDYLIYSSLKKIEAKLPSSSFLRVHRSFIINFKKIVDIEDNSILINKQVIPISRRYKSQLLSQLNLL